MENACTLCQKLAGEKALADCVHGLLAAAIPEIDHASNVLQFNAWGKEPTRGGEHQEHHVVHCRGDSPQISLNAGENWYGLQAACPAKIKSGLGPVAQQLAQGC